MAELMPPSREIREADVSRPFATTQRYRVGPGGTVQPRSAHDERVLRESGWTTKGVGLASAHGGRRCTACGFASWFVTCSRCGGQCAKEAPCPPSTAAAT